MGNRLGSWKWSKYDRISADANETAATGHLMRCMTIAEACREKGVECEFWLAEDKETERLRQAGFSYRILGSQWDDLEKELPF